MVPRLGRRLPEYPRAAMRELLVRPFRIIYRILPDRIEILTVMYVE
ncbi:MAG: type II toxin-antitoxin system RelE/ParE family toxin [Nevskiales bacterium]